jgi:putative phosphoesterase
MILGIYSDLHSNVVALLKMNKILNSVDQWISLGDSVGLFPFINEVLDEQRTKNVLAVNGDHEISLISGKKIENSFTANFSIALQRASISKQNLKYLNTLSENIDVKLANKKIHITHYLHPNLKNHKYIFDLNYLESAYSTYDYVFFGHTHLPAVIYTKTTIFINPGSAGFPVLTSGLASILKINLKTNYFKFYTISFDSQPLKKAIIFYKYPSILNNYLDNNNNWPR